MNDLTKYYKLRPEIKTGDLFEWRSNSLIGCVIRRRTGKDVNHTSMVVRYLSFDSERVYNLEALSEGVYPNLMSRRLSTFNGSVYWLPLRPEFEQYRSSVAKEGHKYIGVKYDFGSIIKQIFGRVSVDIHRFFCSEICWQAALEGGLILAGERKGYIKRKPKSAPWPGEFEDLGIYLSRVRIL